MAAYDIGGEGRKHQLSDAHGAVRLRRKSSACVRHLSLTAMAARIFAAVMGPACKDFGGATMMSVRALQSSTMTCTREHGSTSCVGLLGAPLVAEPPPRSS